MDCEFSETQFMFGVMHELANKCHASGRKWKAPKFPTQREEKELGYDATINDTVCNIFFQFKVPEKKTRQNAKHWDDMNGPYYEFKIWPDDTSPQHNKLIDLAAEDPANKVYYCSPRFHTNVEYEDNYENRTISKNSVYVPCGTLKRISGSESHKVCYTADPSVTPVMYSQPHFAKGVGLGELWEDLTNTDTYRNARECLYSVAQKYSIDIGGKESVSEIYNEIANYLLVNENVVFILMGK